MVEKKKNEDAGDFTETRPQHETAKRQLNLTAGEAKNDQSQGAEVAPLEPLKEKKRTPVRST